MTDKEKIAVLESYRYILMEIRGHAHELKMWGSISTDISQKYSDMPHGSGSNAAKFERPVERIADIVRGIENDLQKAKENRERIKEGVENIENIRYRTLLKLWYIDCLPLEQITDIMRKSEKSVLYKLRKSALKQLEFPEVK